MLSTESLWTGIEGIVIDAVGTLIHAEPSVAEVYVRAARNQGIHLDAGAVRARFAQRFRDDEEGDRRGPLVTDEGIERARWQRIVAAVLPELEDPQRGFEELWEHFACPGSWRSDEQIGPALEVLRARGIRVRIASNFDARLRRVVAGLPELAGLGDDLVISSEIGHRKPHPAFYRAACERLRLPPGRVLCVGDDPENDVLGPQTAGLRGVLIDRNSECLIDLPRVSGFAELVRPLRARRPGGAVSEVILGP